MRSGAVGTVRLPEGWTPFRERADRPRIQLERLELDFQTSTQAAR